MRRAAAVALLASIATGAALAQDAPWPAGGDSRWSLSAEALFAWFKSSPTPVPIITDNYADCARRQRAARRRLGRHQSQCRLQAARAPTAYRQPHRCRAHRLLHSDAHHVEQRELHRPAGFHRPVPAVLRRHAQRGKRHRDFPPAAPIAAVRRRRCPTISAAASSTVPGRCRARRIASRPRRRLPLSAAARVVHDHHQQPVQPAEPERHLEHHRFVRHAQPFLRLAGGARGARTIRTVGGSEKSPRWRSAPCSNGCRSMASSRPTITPITAETQIFPGGYFALPTNIGDHSRNAFSVVPEIAFNLGYRVTPQATVTLG